VLALGGIEGGAMREKPPFTVVEKTGFLTEGRVALELWNCGGLGGSAPPFSHV